MRRTALILAVALSVLTAATLAGAAVEPERDLRAMEP